jgi:hypothetical protein
VIHATSVTEIPTSSQPIQHGGSTSAYLLSGTIMDLDAAANPNTLTLRVDTAFGPDASVLSALVPTAFTDLTLSVPPSTGIHRGPNILALADLTRGNYCFTICDLNATATGFDALNVDEHPSAISGVVSGTPLQIGGATGGDLATFIPTTVNQVPASQLAFLPNPLKTEVERGSGFQDQDPIRVFGFFDGTDTITDHGFNGHTGPPPPRRDHDHHRPPRGYGRERNALAKRQREPPEVRSGLPEDPDDGPGGSRSQCRSLHRGRQRAPDRGHRGRRVHRPYPVPLSGCRG